MGKQKPKKGRGGFWRKFGPGLTTGAADDDPSGIATYSQAGAQFGLQFLWQAAWSLPFMAVVQEMCGRIGLVTGRGLGANIRRHFSHRALVLVTLLLFGANVFNIGADLGAMAKATELLVPQVPFTLLVVTFAVVSLGLEIFISYKRYASYLKWLTLVLLAYVLTALTLHGVAWGSVLRHTFLPSLHLTRESVLLLCAILGTTISPYLFFWQTSQEVEEEIAEGKVTVAARSRSVGASAINAMRQDVWLGMFFSNLIMFFIILTTGLVLHGAGITSIQTAEQAAAALQPLAGSHASLLFAFGIIGTGLLAVPVLAGSAAYAIAESFQWKEGLSRQFREARAFYTIIIIAVLAGLLMNFLGLNPVRALVASAVANGVIAPIVLFFIVRLSGNAKVMGAHASGRMRSGLGWTLVALMSLVAVAALAALV